MKKTIRQKEGTNRQTDRQIDINSIKLKNRQRERETGSSRIFSFFCYQAVPDGYLVAFIHIYSFQHFFGIISIFFIHFYIFWNYLFEEFLLEWAVQELVPDSQNIYFSKKAEKTGTCL